MTEDDIEEICTFLSKQGKATPRQIELYRAVMRYPNVEPKHLFPKLQQEMGIEGRGEELEAVSSRFYSASEKFMNTAKAEGYPQAMQGMPSPSPHLKLSRDSHFGRKGIRDMRSQSQRYLEQVQETFREYERASPAHLQEQLWRQGFLQCDLSR